MDVLSCEITGSVAVPSTFAPFTKAEYPLTMEAAVAPPLAIVVSTTMLDPACPRIVTPLLILSAMIFACSVESIATVPPEVYPAGIVTVPAFVEISPLVSPLLVMLPVFLPSF